MWVGEGKVFRGRLCCWRDVYRQSFQIIAMPNKYAKLVSKVANWVVPTLYLVLITVCTRLNFLFIINRLDVWGFEYPVMYLLVIINYAVFFLLLFMNPGFVPKGSSSSESASPISIESMVPPEKANHFQANKIIFFSNNKCSTCNVEKLPRTKHCSVCDRCVLLFDHHCIWMNNCIGYRNFKWFVVFLVSLMGILVYGFILNARFMLKFWNLQTLRSSFRFKNLKLIKSLNIKAILMNYVNIYYNFYKLIATAVKSEPQASGLQDAETSNSLGLKFSLIFIIICVIFGMIISVFLHGILHNVGNHGMTENEKSKWLDIQDMINYHYLYKYILTEDEIPEYQNEILFDEKYKKRFIYITKYYYYRTGTPSEKSNEPKTDPEKHKHKSSFDIIKSYFTSSSGNSTESAGASFRNPGNVERVIKYFCLNTYDEKEIFVTMENKDRVKLVRSIDEIDNIYDSGSFRKNMGLIF